MAPSAYARAVSAWLESAPPPCWKSISGGTPNARAISCTEKRRDSSMVPDVSWLIFSAFIPSRRMSGRDAPSAVACMFIQASRMACTV